MGFRNWQLIEDMPAVDRFETPEDYFATLDEFSRDLYIFMDNFLDSSENNSKLHQRIEFIDTYRDTFFESPEKDISSEQDFTYLYDFSIMTEEMLRYANETVSELDQKGAKVEWPEHYEPFLE